MVAWRSRWKRSDCSTARAPKNFPESDLPRCGKAGHPASLVPAAPAARFPSVTGGRWEVQNFEEEPWRGLEETAGEPPSFIHLTGRNHVLEEGQEKSSCFKS